MFEKVNQPLLNRTGYLKRQVRFLSYALIILGGSLLMGASGYVCFGEMSWIDGMYNASMILTGMGPVNVITSDAGKVFASCYALYSGVAFLTTIAVLLSPAIHRFLHALHIDEA